MIASIVLLLLCIIYSQKRRIDTLKRFDLSYFTDQKQDTGAPAPVVPQQKHEVPGSKYVQPASEPQSQQIPRITAAIMDNNTTKQQPPKTDMMFLEKYIPKKGEPATVSALEQSVPMHDTVSREFMQNSISNQLAAR